MLWLYSFSTTHPRSYSPHSISTQFYVCTPPTVKQKNKQKWKSKQPRKKNKKAPIKQNKQTIKQIETKQSQKCTN